MTSTRHSTLSRPRDDELVEKVVSQLYAVLDYVEEAEDDEHKHRQLEIWAGWIIEATLKAVVDGKLELPGEVGRLEQEPQTRPYAQGVEQSLKGWILNRFKEGARTFVALRPTGTGEEE